MHQLGSGVFNLRKRQPIGSRDHIQKGVDVSLATHNDRATVMNFFRNNLKNPRDFALKYSRRRTPTCVLRYQCHRKTLVQDSKLPFGGFFVGGVKEDASV